MLYKFYLSSSFLASNSVVHVNASYFCFPHKFLLFSTDYFMNILKLSDSIDTSYLNVFNIVFRSLNCYLISINFVVKDESVLNSDFISHPNVTILFETWLVNSKLWC